MHFSASSYFDLSATTIYSSLLKQSFFLLLVFVCLEVRILILLCAYGGHVLMLLIIGREPFMGRSESGPFASRNQRRNDVKVSIDNYLLQFIIN